MEGFLFELEFILGSSWLAGGRGSWEGERAELRRLDGVC